MTIHVTPDFQPSNAIAKMLRDRMRATSPVYEFLIHAAGIGVAEAWIEALAWERGRVGWGASEGWYLSSTEESERIAKTLARNKSRKPCEPALLAFSLRAWEQAKRDYDTGPLSR